MSSAGGQMAATPGSSAAQGISQAAIPDGIRLMLTLPVTQAVSGRLTVDWVNPTLSGDKS
jgi:general secretion pathway protein J